ncbi:MAG: pyridoxal phosphate-dependent aminotransferase [Oscillochloris sp.]|nr:pyridoxal phosphate-dependent aminotransferase [Oscillochloris sp.]
MPGVFDDLDLTPNDLELARQQQAAGAGYIDLTSSNPTAQGLIFPPEILRAATADFWETRGYTPDPHGNPQARAAIAAYYATRTPPLQLAPDDLFITASTSEAYALLFALLADPGDNLLAPNVSYPLFEYLAALRGIELRSYDLIEAENWRIDGRSLLAAADARTRGVLIVSPHNPTGAVVQAAVPALELLGLPIICDEVFAAFAYAIANVPPLAALHPTVPVLTLNGISKLFALPDLKLGWIGLNTAARHLAPRLELLNDTFLGANSLSQHLLPALFSQGMPFVAAMVERVRRNLDFACATLAGHRRVVAPKPEGGYYLFPAIREFSDEDTVVLQLLHQGVLVHPGYFFGDPPGIHLMISALTAPPQFSAGITHIAEALN